VLVIVKLPLAGPDAVGAKVTLTVMLWPTFSVVGRVLPANANGPEAAMLLTVIDSEPLFDTNIGWAGLGSLTVTFPRFNVVGDTARLRLAEGCACCEPGFNAHPASTAKRTS
jgi:hypothetical protein